MKKSAIIAGVVILTGVVALILFKNFSAEPASAGAEVSARAAEGLQMKIDAIKKAKTVQGPKRESVEVLETELESYVLFSLREDIPARLDAFDVQLTPGEVAADTRMTFSSNSTGNPMIDALIGGTHNMFIKGRLTASGGTGKFDLEQVRLDGIPVPNIFIEALISKYVKPKYPDVDLNAPFEMPWGIDSLTVTQGKATVVY